MRPITSEPSPGEKSDYFHGYSERASERKLTPREYCPPLPGAVLKDRMPFSPKAQLAGGAC
jgi:hypothetical protein